MDRKTTTNRVYKIEADNASMFLLFANEITEELNSLPDSAKNAILNKKAGGCFFRDFSSGSFCFYIFVRPNKNEELCLPFLNHELLHFAKWLASLEANKAMDEELIKRGYPLEKVQEEKECNLLQTVSSFFYQIVQCEKIPTTFQIEEGETPE